MNEREIFTAALQLASQQERAAYLESACGADLELRQRIEALLAQEADLGSFLADQANVMLTQKMPPVTEQPGDTIGPYKLLQQIGEGGMGVVYMAEQTHPVERRVALKIIKPGMDTRQVIARFEAERQALAMMDHPNIAKVLDAGTTDSGRPYFVMELVKGMPVTQFCDEQHLTPRERLELFVPICQAVQHAHQKGIIHRDLKPTNILIAQYDDKPVPKIIDFGVAKAISHNLTEKTMFTQYGQIVGTIEYMSPEQARFNQLDVDTRSDVYSLGVLLYELLTGETPFDKKRLRSAAFDELLRIIREEEPPRPSTILSSSETLASTAINRKTEPNKLSLLVRGELDWIVMKALEKDRSRRYETANGFAADVQRYLNDEPVQACPPSAGYKFRKFVRRNKATLATATMVAVALVAGIIGTTWQAVRATREADRATHEANEAKSARAAAVDAGNVAHQKEAEAIAALKQAELQRQQANENFDKARRAVDEYLTQVTESELLTVPGLQPLREDLLQAALKFYAEFTQERADDPSLHRELASAHYRLARIQIDLGNAAASKAANQEAIRLFEQLRDRGDVSVDVQADLASAYFFGARYDDTVKLCQAVLQVEPKQAEVRSLLADTYNQLAVADGNKSNVAAALKHHQQAFELREALVSDFPDNPKYLAQLGGTVNNLGVLLSKQGKQDAALAMFERAVEYSAQAYERAPHSILWGRWLCTGLRNIASNQAALDKQEEALRSYERLVTISRKRAFENPAIGSLRADLYVAYLELGKHQKRLDDPTAGSRSFRLAREVLEQIPRETPDQLFELATVYAVLATSEAESDEPSEDDAAELKRNADLAMETLKKAVDAGYQNASALGTNKDLDPLRARDDFQTLLATVQTFAEADRLAKANDTDPAKNLTSRQQAVDLLKELANSQGGEVRHRTTLAATLHSIGVIQTGLKQFDEAEKSFDEALKLRQELLKERAAPPETLVDTLSTRAAIGQLDWDRDRPQDAHRLFQEILTECQRLAVEHGEDARLQTGIVGVERSIANKYGDSGLLGAYLQSVDRALETGQLFDPAGDCRGAHVLAALGRLAEHRQLCQLIADKWGKSIPAQTVWAAAMNPEPVVEVERLLELAERVIESDLDPLWKFKAATAWYRAGEYDRALELMLAARENVTASGSAACLYWYALVYHKQGQEQLAAQYLDEAEANYLNSVANCLLGSEKSAVKDAHAGAWWTWSEDQAARRLAWNELRGTVDLHDPWQHLIQARAFQLIGEQSKHDAELAAAEKAWQRAVELDGNDPRPWIQRGRWYTERGQHEQADADFTRAASLTPNELNKFLEAGWWASMTPHGLSPLLPRQTDNFPALAAPEAAPVPFTVVRSTPYGMGQQVEFRNTSELKEADTAYAMTCVYAPEAKGVTLLVGGAASVELRLNGRRIYESKTYRSAFYAERVPVLLRAGRNTLVARVPDPGRSQSLILRIADNRLDRGLELAQFGLWDEALPLLNAEFAEGRRPNEQVWSFFSGLLSATGDFAAYRELYHKVLNWIGDSPSWSVSLHASLSCTRAPVPETDIARLMRLVDEAALNASASNKRWAGDVQSRVYVRSGRYQEVLDRNQTGGWRESILRALCWHHLGEANKAKSDLARAEGEFLEIVRMGPEGPASAAVLSYGHGMLDILGDYVLLREARTLIAPGSSPDDEALHALQSQVRQQLQAADFRLLPFEMALIHNGKDPERWLQRGRARALLGQWESAQADFARAVAMSPDDPEVLATRCLIYAELNRVEEALVDFVKVVEDDSDSAKAPGWLAARQRLFDELGRWPELFDSVTRLRPDDPQPWIRRARYHLSRSHWPDAASDDARAAEMAVADLREAVKRGFRDFDQPQSDVDWQLLESREDYRKLVRETAEGNLDELMLLAKLDAHTDVVRGVAFLPDGRRIVSVGRDKMVRIWDVESRSVLSTLPVEGYLTDADVAADGRLVAVVSSGGAKKAVAQVWDLEKGECLCDLVQDFSKWAACVRLSPDGTRVVTSGNPPQGVLWNVATGKELRRFETDESSVLDTAAFAPSGQIVALGVVGRVRLFDVESGEVLQEVRLLNNRFISDVVFSSSGKSVATGQNGGHVSLIDVASGRVMKTLQDSDLTARRVKFLNEDRFLLTGFHDGPLQIWDIEREKVVAKATPGKGTNERLAVSADGRYAVTAGGQAWDNETSKWKATGDYALRLWRLPRTVWTTQPAQQPSIVDAAAQPE